MIFFLIFLECHEVLNLLYNYFSQTSVSGGKILRMGKGFTIEGVEGYDLSALFLEAFQRKVKREREREREESGF